MHYFGPWSDPDVALDAYLKVKDVLQNGRTPREETAGVTVKDVNVGDEQCTFGSRPATRSVIGGFQFLKFLPARWVTEKDLQFPLPLRKRLFQAITGLPR